MKRVAIIAIAIGIIVILADLSLLCAAERGLKFVTVKTSQGERIELYINSYALVVGNSNYSNGWDPIPGAIRDVGEVAAALEKHGFAVTLKTDLSKDKFSRALNEFALKYGREKDNRLLFYYAGHGFTQQMATGEELGYLVMVNAPLPEADLIGFSLNSVDMQSLITQGQDHPGPACAFYVRQLLFGLDHQHARAGGSPQHFRQCQISGPAVYHRRARQRAGAGSKCL